MLVVIDVREPFEYRDGHVEGAINIPLNQMSPDNPALSGLNKDDKVVLYCASGNRAGHAQRFLESLGFSNVTNGINAAHVNQEYGPDPSKDQ